MVQRVLNSLVQTDGRECDSFFEGMSTCLTKDLSHYHTSTVRHCLKTEEIKCSCSTGERKFLSQISLKCERIDASKTDKFNDPSLLRCCNVSASKYFPCPLVSTVVITSTPTVTNSCHIFQLHLQQVLSLTQVCHLSAAKCWYSVSG